MILESIIFYIFAILLVGTAIMVVTRHNPVHSALFLVLTFFSAAAIWIMLEAEFLALILVLVYVGAVMTLFLFVIMMLRPDALPDKNTILRYLPWSIGIVVLFLIGLFFALGGRHFNAMDFAFPAGQTTNYSNIRELGSVLYTHFVYPFELAAILLLVAIVSAISLSLRKPRRKKQVVAEQIKVRRDDRVRLVSMPTQKNSLTNDPSSLN